MTAHRDRFFFRRNDHTAPNRPLLRPDLGTPRAPDPAVDDVVDPRDIEAIEVCRSGVEVPAVFGGMSPFTRCGAIVIWTRRGR